MNVLIKRERREEIFVFIQSRCGLTSNRQSNISKQSAIKTDGAYLARTIPAITLQNILSFLQSQIVFLSEIETAAEDTSVEIKLHFRIKMMVLCHF